MDFTQHEKKKKQPAQNGNYTYANISKRSATNKN